MDPSKSLLVALAGALLLTGAAGIASAASQNWYLTFDGELVADRSGVPPGTEDFMPVPDNTFEIWWANEDAGVDVDFGTGDFSYNILVTRDFTGSWEVVVGYGTRGAAGFEGPGFASAPIVTGAAGTYTGAIPVVDFVVPTGKTLGFMVVNTDEPGTPTTSQTVRVDTTGQSFFTSTRADPGYPTPELGTIALAAAGLGLVALVAFRRRG